MKYKKRQQLQLTSRSKPINVPNAQKPRNSIDLKVGESLTHSIIGKNEFQHNERKIRKGLPSTAEAYYRRQK